MILFNCSLKLENFLRSILNMIFQSGPIPVTKNLCQPRANQYEMIENLFNFILRRYLIKFKLDGMKTKLNLIKTIFLKTVSIHRYPVLILHSSLF